MPDIIDEIKTSYDIKAYLYNDATIVITSNSKGGMITLMFTCGDIEKIATMIERFKTKGTQACTP